MTATPEKPAEKEHKVISLKLDRIRLDGGTQSRASFDNDTAERYAQDMRDGCVFPQMHVFRGVDDRTPDDFTIYDWLARGFHRWHAFDKVRKGNKREEFCRVFQGSRREAVLHSVNDNSRHGLQRTDPDMDYAVRLILDDDEWWGATDTWIAELCHVDRSRVRKVRDIMEEEWKLEEERAASLGESPSEKKPRRPQRKRRGRSKHGGTRTINTGNIGGTPSKNGQKIKPIRRETEIAQLAKLHAMIERSSKKPVVQAKAAGWDEERLMAKVREWWALIPVVEDG